MEQIHLDENEIRQINIANNYTLLRLMIIDGATLVIRKTDTGNINICNHTTEAGVILFNLERKIVDIDITGYNEVSFHSTIGCNLMFELCNMI